MAFSKKQKAEMLTDYDGWFEQSQAVFVLEYTKMRMKDVDALRVKVRETGGHIHVVKNTLVVRALQTHGYQVSSLEGSLLFAFAESNPPALAKVMMEVTRNSEMLTLRGGYMEKQTLSAADVKALAELPPLPVLRAILLGVISAPATKLVRTLSEPGRQVARVFAAYSEKAAAPASA